MKAYFYSPLKALLYKNNSYLFSFSKNLKTQFLEKDDLLTFVLPCDYSPCFAPVSNLKYSQNVKIIDLYEGFLFFVTPKRKYDEPFKTLFSHSFVCGGIEHNLTVLSDGGVRLLIDGFNSFCEIEVPFIPKNFTIEKRGDFFFIALKDKLVSFNAFSCQPLECVFSTCCKDYKIEDNSFSIDKFSRGVCDYTYREVYSINQTIEKQASYLIKNNEPKEIKNEFLKTQAFLEEVMLGGEYQNFLCESLKTKTKEIKAFLGDYELILPPVEAKHPKTFALISKSKARYFTCAFENGLICDFSVDENFKNV